MTSTQTQDVGTLVIGDDENLSDTSQDLYWCKLIPTPNNPVSYKDIINVEKDTHTFGRSRSNDTHFDNPGISGIHAKLIREEEGSSLLLWLLDNSTNGTFVNGSNIGKSKRKLLKNGDTLIFLKTSDCEIGYIFAVVPKSEEQHEVFKKYEVGEKLGSGNFAEVKLAINKETGEKFALKIINKKKFALSSSSTRQNSLLDEVDILQKINHPGCISIEEMFETEDTLYLVLEFVSGGELFDRIIEVKNFNEDMTRLYMKQMLDAVNYLHSQGIAHRDLKPENILLKSKDSDIIKLSDFGLSRMMSKESFLKTMCGTPGYVAPEVLLNSDKGGYGAACDIWSLGVIAYILLCGIPPFHEEKEISLYDQITTGDFEFPNRLWSDISEEAKDFVEKLIVVDPEKRLTAEAALSHPFMLNKTLEYSRTLRKNERPKKKHKVE